MLHTRIIPCLLLKNQGLVKTVKFKKETYIGDPINAIKIFNDKEVDELVLLDITATLENRKPRFDYISELAGECFMPLAYGGGITSLDDIRALNKIGVEKVILNSIAMQDPDFVKAAVEEFGSSTIVVCMDVKKNFWGKFEVFTHAGKKGTGVSPQKFAAELEKAGVGELIIQSIDNDGVMKGYDLELIRQVSQLVSMPVVACGGAGNISHFSAALKEGASAVAAGSMFVFHGPHKAVLINYPSQEALKAI